MTAARALAVVAALAGAACGSRKQAAIAELVQADGAVDRQDQRAAWSPAKVGAEFFLGDSVRTQDAGAQLRLAGTAKLAMQAHTILHFGGTATRATLAIEAGAYDLSGGGDFGLDVGDVKLGARGAVRIRAAADGKSTIELLVGDAQLSQQGNLRDLEVGKPVAIDVAIGNVTIGDAGVRDAAPPADAAAPVDAAPVDAAPTAGDVAQADIVGKRAEIRTADDNKWRPLDAGPATLAKGTKLRLGAGTSARLVAIGTTIELPAGSRAVLGDDLVFAIEATVGAKASVAAGAHGKVALPGGGIELDATGEPAEASIDVNAREGRVKVLHPSVRLAGGAGATHDMAARGETATLANKGGAIHVVEAIPRYFDFAFPVGETLIVHDPRPPVAVKFDFRGKCPGGGEIELDRDARFHAPRLSAGKDAANLLVTGSWAYRLLCSGGAVAATGRISVIADAGRRPLPKVEPTNDVDADGRSYRIDFASQIPNVVVHAKRGGAGTKLHVASGGKDDVYDGAAQVTVPGKSLHEGTYTFWFEHDGIQDKVTSLRITFENTAPQVYIEAPANGQPFAPEIDVRGAALAGWTAKIDGVDVPMDGQHRFTAKVPPPEGGALAIRLAHPQRGIHYYLRRPK